MRIVRIDTTFEKKINDERCCFLRSSSRHRQVEGSIASSTRHVALAYVILGSVQPELWRREQEIGQGVELNQSR